MKLFIDSDVILDVFLKREPFNLASSKILNLSKTSVDYSFCTTVICIANITYLLQISFNREETKEILHILLSGIELIPVDKNSILDAINSEFKDIEDAYQHFSALNAKVDLIITRNKRDYKSSEIPVVTPTEFLGG